MTTGSPKNPPAPPHEAAARRDWPAYFDRMKGKPPRETLTTALDAFGPVDRVNPPLALDIGCGAGRDVVEMLERGWRVWAQDDSEDGLERLRARPDCAAAIAEGRLEVVSASFEQARPPTAMLVNASFSLPFCPPDAWPGLWGRLDAAVLPGGRFSGQFFGDRDDWAIIEDRTHLTRAQALDLFSQYVIESFREEDRASTHTGDAHKHWHVFHVVARKR
ncbi:MAG: class I SAM-dependent methyltransferase [Phycisphaerales bacterium]